MQQKGNKIRVEGISFPIMFDASYSCIPTSNYGTVNRHLPQAFERFLVRRMFVQTYLPYVIVTGLTWYCYNNSVLRGYYYSNFLGMYVTNWCDNMISFSERHLPFALLSKHILRINRHTVTRYGEF